MKKIHLTKKSIPIIISVVFLTVAVVTTIVCFCLPRPASPLDPGKLYNNFNAAVKDEIEKEEGITITTSKVNNVVYANHSLNVDFTYDTDNSLSIVFVYNESMTIATILDYVYDIAKLPTSTEDIEYIAGTPITSDISSYVSMMNTHYTKTFTKATAFEDMTQTNAYVSGLAKNSDESITTVMDFKIKKSTSEFQDAGIKVDVNKSDTDKYYLLLDYLIK